MAAFDKPCAPAVTPIGDYQLIDSCSVPQPPEPIVTPLDIPVPIPPIDNGCYPLNVSGRFHGPDDPATPEDGALSVTVSYPTGDPCEPEIVVDVFVPCSVSFGTVQATAEFDYTLTETEVAVSGTNDNCALGLSLHFGFPCPTSITGAPGTVRFDPANTTGTLGVTTTNIDDSCDIALALDLVLPCPGAVTAAAQIVDNIDTGSSSSAEFDTCALIPPSRRPRILLQARNVERTDPSSSIGVPSCDVNLDLQLAVPCPIIWQKPSARVIRTLDYGQPEVRLTVNEGSSSSDCMQDCQPKLTLDLTLPCPMQFSINDSSSNITFGVSNTHPWAERPTATLDVRFGTDSSSNEDRCAPILAFDLDLPCPVNFKIGDQSSLSNVRTFDAEYFLGELVENPVPQRRWAFGNPKASLTIEYGENDEGVTTRCVPILDLDLNLPCPTGGRHRPISSSVNDPEDDRTFTYERELAILEERQADYVEQYGTVDAPKHPYFSLIPDCKIEINQDLDYFATPGREQFAKNARGHVTKLEFDDNCRLDFGMSLYIPCGVRAPDFKFYDIQDIGEAAPTELPSTEYQIRVIQDWTDGPDAGDCAFDETVQLFVPRHGGGSGGAFAMIAARAGTTPPYRYAATGAAMDGDGVWTANEDVEYENVFNIEEQGTGGQYVNPLNVGDVIEINTNPSGADSYICKRSHYRGTY